VEKVTREAVEGAIEKIFSHYPAQGEVDTRVLIRSLIEELQPQTRLSQNQKDALGEAVFFHPEILKQLEQSANEPEDGDISSYDDYLKFKNGVSHEGR
jgi:hypothetical protein